MSSVRGFAIPLDESLDFLDLHHANPSRYPVLFESSAFNENIGRYDYLLVSSGEVHADSGDVFGLIDSLYAALPDVIVDAGLPQFVGGYGLFLSYEMAQQVEPILALPLAVGSLPRSCIVRTPLVLARDRVTAKTFLLGDPSFSDLRDSVLADIACVSAHGAMLPALSDVVEEEPSQFTDAVVRVLEYLRAGDVFQANLSRGWTATFDEDVKPAALFQRLRERNPAPFAGLFHTPHATIVSASPERLVGVSGRNVTTRPIAGTRPRINTADDAQVIEELTQHTKERAEHVMLIDLERNDLGRICTPGSVEVNELMVVESYRHVHHIVSNVRGVLREEITPGQVLKSTFPGGTITGCPKVRCMQIIAELEPQGRGAYTGSMGWISKSNGLQMDTNILIRSAEVEGNTARFRAGAGIVLDSQPDKELEETRAKAKGMLRAIAAE